MRVLALTRYQRLGSSSRVRFYQYFPYLKAQGIDIVNVPFFGDDYVYNLYTGRGSSIKAITQAYLKRIFTLAHGASFDLLWVEKELLPWFPAWLESLFQAFHIPFIVDYDDAVFHRYDMHPTPLVRRLLGHKIDSVMRHAALVIVGNKYLADKAVKAGARRVEILPSVVDVSRYRLKKPIEASTFNIGWIGSPVTTPYLNIISEALSQLNRESSINLVLIGAGNIQSFHSISTEILPWSEEIELTLSQKFDVGLMPLLDLQDNR